MFLADTGGASWLEAAKGIQDQYAKGSIEARFLAVPVQFVRAAIEVKIQSLPRNAQKDIAGLKVLREEHPSCACFFVLLNARGRARDHDEIVRMGEAAEVPVMEYTAVR